MKFYAIGYRYQEDVYVNFEKHEDTFDMSSECLLPTYEMAEEYIEEQLDMAYIVIPIEIETVNKGVWSWSREEVPEWDELYEDDE